MTRVLVDTTYLLPAAGIAVQAVPADALRRLKEAGHEVLASQISLFEVLAKGAKLASEGRADAERVSLAVKSILSDASVGKADTYDEDTMTMAIEFRRHHNDFVDCLIVAAAASHCDALVTEDSAIAKNGDLMKAILRHKPEFKILALRDVLARHW